MKSHSCHCCRVADVASSWCLCCCPTVVCNIASSLHAVAVVVARWWYLLKWYRCVFLLLLCIQSTVVAKGFSPFRVQRVSLQYWIPVEYLFLPTLGGSHNQTISNKKRGQNRSYGNSMFYILNIFLLCFAVGLTTKSRWKWPQLPPQMGCNCCQVKLQNAAPDPTEVQHVFSKTMFHGYGCFQK